MSHGSFSTAKPSSPPINEDEEYKEQEILMQEFLDLLKRMGVHIYTDLAVTYEKRTKENSARLIKTTISAAKCPSPEPEEATGPANAAEAAEAAKPAAPTPGPAPATNDNTGDAEAAAENEEDNGQVHLGTGIGGMTIGL